MEVFRKKLGTENNYFQHQWAMIFSSGFFLHFVTKCFLPWMDTILFNLGLGILRMFFLSTYVPFFLLLQNAYEVNVFCLSTFSHNIYSFWWSMLILPCQCNLCSSLFLLSFTFNTSVAAELSSPSKHTVVWPNSVYSIYWVTCVLNKYMIWS